MDIDIENQLLDKINEKLNIVSKINKEIIEINKELVTHIANQIIEKYNIKKDIIFKCNDIDQYTVHGVIKKVISFVDKNDEKKIIAKYHFSDFYEGCTIYEKFIKDCDNNDNIDNFFQEINNIIFWECI
jgi:hypothetical protein